MLYAIEPESFCSRLRFLEVIWLPKVRSAVMEAPQVRFCITSCSQPWQPSASPDKAGYEARHAALAFGVPCADPAVFVDSVYPIFHR